ncbi:unnamed protein product [Choristocarpus tenellus]
MRSLPLLNLVGLSTFSATSAFVAPCSSRLTAHTCKAISTSQANRYHHGTRTSTVSMMAKKKKGPAADALASLEALEQQEALSMTETVELQPPKQPTQSTPSKSKKNKRKGPAADALAALEELEQDGGTLDSEGQSTTPPEVEMNLKESKKVNPPQAKSKKNKRKGPAADALAALEELEQDEGTLDSEGPSTMPPEVEMNLKARMLDSEESFTMQLEVGMDLEESMEVNLMQPQVQGKKKKKGKQGKVSEDSQEQPVVETTPAEIEDVQVPASSGDGSEAGASVTDVVIEETLEEKIRKTRPPPRVRISEETQPGFVSLRLDKVAVTFRNQQVVQDASWEVHTGDRLGLVGPNGGGKTTQIKILAGDIQPTAGEVIKSSKDLRVALLRQEFVDELVMERSLKDEMRSVFVEEEALLKSLQLCEEELQLKEVQEDPDKMEDVLNRLADLQEEIERKKVYDLDTKVQRIMDLMGFLPSEGEQPVSSFSGGWRMRIGLGKILLQDPNMLLLDEPTNHLDLESVEWLEQFLINQNLPMVLVSHDREFLDRVCTGIVDTDGGITSTYPGNYSRFLKLKKLKLESQEAAYRNQQKKIKEEKAWINKFKSKGAWATQVKSRQKALEKLLASDKYVKPPTNYGKPFRFRFPPAPRSSQEVLTVSHVHHGYPGRTLFEDANLVVDKGQRLAFLGPNGAGKSTLLRLIMGKEEPNEGTSTLGPSVVAQYFEQNQADALDLSKTVMQTLESASTLEKHEDLRKLLGQFLFKGDAVKKTVGQLSGGEKARVALCKMMLTPANLLVLDEPTNHLDIPAKEMLEEALQHYEGAVVVVSHDRYFVSQVATTVCDIKDRALSRYDGDYRYYLDRNDDILDKVESRYVSGLSGIKSAKRVETSDGQDASTGSGKKSFGGKGGPSGRKDKGVKNAKRFSEKKE